MRREGVCAVCWCGTDKFGDLVLLLGTPPQRGLDGLRDWPAHSGMTFERAKARVEVRLVVQTPYGRRDVLDILAQEYVEAPAWNHQMKYHAEAQAALLLIHQEVALYRIAGKCYWTAT